MKTYAVTYSYPTWDRNYRGQRGVVVQAEDEADALRIIRTVQVDGGYPPVPDAQIVRIRERVQ